MNESNCHSRLPQGLVHLETRVTPDDKDTIVYYHLLKNTGRTLIFVNTIKNAKRLDGLLRALGFNCRTIHAQLQQRQRLRALDSFKAAPVGVLVATDVAARGLDIPKIQFVLHYDVSRSPQGYIHRSGRTARAASSGESLSIISPDDVQYHRNICSTLETTKFTPLKPELSVLPNLRERIKAAKKMFTLSFIVSQKQKERSWIAQVQRK